ncbi:ankyrin repeat domain-containing protein [Rhodococcoides yunnanense]|uniref:ankyrin repeat domain-containing protein n=1 Tax=Rhodococcoides yunnanense TaxID=278209 RepID=UPI0009321DE5|nr:ankyrin repeat domain-containing protein [Rhodococcus yunnanensis]
MPDIDEFGRTALHYAAAENRINDVRQLLADGADVNSRDHQQWTPLIFAAQLGFVDVVTVLLNHGADVNAINSTGRSALERAIMAPKNDGASNAIATIRVLRDRGADATSKTITSDYFDPISPLDIVRDHIRNSEVAAEFADLP